MDERVRLEIPRWAIQLLRSELVDARRQYPGLRFEVEESDNWLEGEARVRIVGLKPDRTVSFGINLMEFARKSNNILGSQRRMRGILREQFEPYGIVVDKWRGLREEDKEPAPYVPYQFDEKRIAWMEEQEYRAKKSMELEAKMIAKERMWKSRGEAPILEPDDFFPMKPIPEGPRQIEPQWRERPSRDQAIEVWYSKAVEQMDLLRRENAELKQRLQGQFAAPISPPPYWENGTPPPSPPPTSQDWRARMTDPITGIAFPVQAAPSVTPAMVASMAGLPAEYLQAFAAILSKQQAAADVKALCAPKADPDAERKISFED